MSNFGGFRWSFCKNQLDVFSMDVAIENEGQVEDKYTQSSIVAAASTSWENWYKFIG